MGADGEEEEEAGRKGTCFNRSQMQDKTENRSVGLEIIEGGKIPTKGDDAIRLLVLKGKVERDERTRKQGRRKNGNRNEDGRIV